MSMPVRAAMVQLRFCGKNTGLLAVLRGATAGVAAT